MTSQKLEELYARMAACGIREEDLVERFVKGSGKGGQKVNKTSSCVYLKHIPTGIEVKCQRERQREMNRFFARRQLCEKMETLSGQKSKKTLAIEKLRKQKQRRQRRSRSSNASSPVASPQENPGVSL